MNESETLPRPSFWSSRRAVLAAWALAGCLLAPASAQSDGAPGTSADASADQSADGSGDAARPTAPSDAPPVLIWMVDTLRADHLSAYGYERPTSPRLDAFAADGVLFEQAHAHSNWTQPSVSSLLTGLYPVTYGGDFTNTVPRELLLAAEWLGAHGYVTAGFTVSVAVAAVFGFDQGFDVYEELEDDLPRRERKRRSGDAFDAERIVERALRWLDEERDPERPFFLYLHTVDPHMPHELHPGGASWGAPEAYEGPLDGSVDNLRAALTERWELGEADRAWLVDLYDGEVAYNDLWFGRLLDGLVERGLGHTLVVFVSDHGEELWDRTTYGHGHENLHAELTHVPLVLGRADAGRPSAMADEAEPRSGVEAAGAGAPASSTSADVLPRGARVPGLVGLVDVLPTVLEAAGLPALPGADGRSLLADVVAGRPAGEGSPPHQHFMDRGQKPFDLRGVRTPRMLFLADPVRKRQLLYDIYADPGASRNLAKRRPGEARDLFNALGKWQRDIRARAADLEVRELDLDPETLARLQALGYVR